MATTTDAKITRSDSCKGSIPVAATKVLPQGSLAFRDSNGYGTDVVATGSNPLVGVVEERADNTSGANGDVNAELFQEGKFVLPFTGASLTQADVYKRAYATDNNTLTLTSSNASPVGTITRVDGAEVAQVQIEIELPSD